MSDIVGICGILISGIFISGILGILGGSLINNNIINNKLNAICPPKRNFFHTTSDLSIVNNYNIKKIYSKWYTYIICH